MFLFKPNNKNNEAENNTDESVTLSASDVLKSVSVKITDVSTAPVIIESPVEQSETNVGEDNVNPEIEAENQDLDIDLQENEMPKTINIDEFKHSVEAFFSSLFKTQEEIAVIETNEAQEKLAEVEAEKAKQEEELKNVQAELAKFKQEKEEAEAKIVEAEQKRQEEAELAEKEAILKMAKEELSFADGTPEENAEKLFNLKQSLNENNEMYDFVINSLKKQSSSVEQILAPAGEDVKDVRVTPEDELEALAQAIMAEEPKSSYAKAYKKAMKQNPELAKKVIRG